MKYTCFLLFLFVFIVACTKSSEPTILDQRTNNLSISNSKTAKWKLMAVSFNSLQQPLTNAQNSFVKQYSSDGKFSDSDGLKGTWNMPAQDSLMETYINFGSGITVSQKYFINELSASQLILTYIVNGTNITTSYSAIP